MEQETNQSIQQETTQSSQAETQPTQHLPQVTTVTKHPGRVKAGKMVAEWNKQRRLSKQAKENILSGEPEKQQTLIDPPKNETAKPDTQPYMLYVITGICAGYALYTAWKSKQKATTKQEQPQQQTKPQPQQQTKPQPSQADKQPANDPFEMH